MTTDQLVSKAVFFNMLELLQNEAAELEHFNSIHLPTLIESCRYLKAKEDLLTTSRLVTSMVATKFVSSVKALALTRQTLREEFGVGSYVLFQGQRIHQQLHTAQKQLEECGLWPSGAIPELMKQAHDILVDELSILENMDPDIQKSTQAAH